MKATRIDLKSVKINGLGIEAKYMQEGKELSVKCKEPIHPDLRDAFDKLKPYFVDICEMEEADDINWKNLDEPETVAALGNYSISGLNMSGSDSAFCISISGHRLLKSVKTLNINSPRMNISNENTEYDSDRSQYLRDICQQIAFETEAYIIDRKFAYTEQALPFKDDDTDPFEEKS